MTGNILGFSGVYVITILRIDLKIVDEIILIFQISVIQEDYLREKERQKDLKETKAKEEAENKIKRKHDFDKIVAQKRRKYEEDKKKKSSSSSHSPRTSSESKQELEVKKEPENEKEPEPPIGPQRYEGPTRGRGTNFIIGKIPGRKDDKKKEEEDKNRGISIKLGPTNLAQPKRGVLNILEQSKKGNKPPAMTKEQLLEKSQFLLETVKKRRAEAEAKKKRKEEAEEKNMELLVNEYVPPEDPKIEGPKEKEPGTIPMPEIKTEPKAKPLDIPVPTLQRVNIPLPTVFPPQGIPLPMDITAETDIKTEEMEEVLYDPLEAARIQAEKDAEEAARVKAEKAAAKIAEHQAELKMLGIDDDTAQMNVKVKPPPHVAAVKSGRT